MSFISEEIIREVREKTDIVDVIGQYVSLTKRGNNYSCSCPFHEDRNPSFSIHTGKQIFKCFSCGRGGNVFSFLQEIEGISFPEAVKKAAEMANVPVEISVGNQSSAVNQQHQPLYEIHEKAANFYQYYLVQTQNGSEAFDYLTNRQLDKAIIEQFMLGLSPEKSDILYQYLSNEGFNDQQLVESGIFYQLDSGQLIDRFKGRIIFPLKNAQGKVVGFSGRIFLSSTREEAKYINSPETEIFQKNQLLYHFDEARLAIRQKKQAIVCEGFLDVIRLVQHGYPQTVATMGTSLTENHLTILSKITQEIIFLFDGDEAGQKATNRAFEIAVPFKNQTFKTVILPNQQDPDEWLQQNHGKNLQTLIDQAIGAFDFQKSHLKRQYQLNNDHDLAQYIEQVIQLISQIQSPIERQLRIQDLSKEYQLDEAMIKEQIASRHFNQYEGGVNPPPNDEVLSYEPYQHNEPMQAEFDIKSKRAYEAEKLLLQALIYYQDAWIYLEKHHPNPVFFHEFFQRLYFEIEKGYYDKGLPLPMLDLGNMIEEDLVALYHQIIWDYRFDQYDDVILADCFKVIHQEFITLEINEWRDKLKSYRQAQQPLDVMEAMNHIVRLTKQLKHKED